MKIKAENYHYILIFFLGLTPLLWFEPEYLIKQIDFDLPLTLERFKATFFSMWDYRNGAGLPRSLHMPAFMFFLPQAAMGLLGFSLETIQRFFFCFWFMLPGFAFYYLMKSLLPENSLGNYAGRLVAVSFYMFNLYLEPIWIGFNMANLSSYVAVPFALGVLIKSLPQKSSIYLTAFKVALIFTLFPAMATNPSMTLIAAVPFVVLVIKYLFDEKFKLASIGYIIGLLTLTVTLLGLFNLYWIWPEVKKLFEANMVLTSSGVMGGSLSEDVFFVTDWLKGISSRTSIPAVIKMQGDWPWYQGYRDYVSTYWGNPLWIILAWFPFALSVFALWKAKHQYKWFFGGMLIVALILSTGLHPPFGILFKFLLENVPLFWTIRSPWYKFTFLTCLGYGVLIGLGSQIIFNALSTRKTKWLNTRYIAILLIFIAVSPTYAFPLVKGKHFRRPGPEQGYPNHFKLPSHAKKAADWFNQQKEGGRILDLPSRGITYNEWGYEGFLPLIGYFTHWPLMVDNHPLHIPYQGAWGSSWMYMQKLTRNAFERGLTPYVSNLMRLLRIRYILHEQDFKYPVLPFPTSVKEINSKVDSMVGVEPAKTFEDKWRVWELENLVPEVYSIDKVSLVNGSIDSFVPLSVRMNEEEPGYVLLPEIGSETFETLIAEKTIGEVISFEESLMDWAIESLNPIYLHRITVKNSEEWMVSKTKKFLLSKSDDYLIFAKKLVANREINLRLGVDFTPYPQTTKIHWNLNLFQHSIKEIKKSDFLPENVQMVALKSLVILFGIQYQDVSFHLVKKAANIFLDKNKQGIWNQACLVIDGKSGLNIDQDVHQLSQKYESKKWEFLGTRFFEEGSHRLFAQAVLNRRSVWEFYVVPKQHFMQRFEQVLSLFKDKSVGQSYLLSSTSNWTSVSDLERKSYVITDVEGLEAESDIYNRTFGYSIFNKEFECSASGSYSIIVKNDFDKPIKKSLAFNVISLQKGPKTFDVQFNGKKIRQIIVDPMQNFAIFLKNLEFKPGKNRVSLSFYAGAIPLGELLGNEEPREVQFGVRNIRVGDLTFREKFVIPSERAFTVKLFPFLGKNQNKKAFQAAKHISSVVIDDRELLLEDVLDGEKGMFLQTKEPILLKEGTHFIGFSKQMDPDYFILLQSVVKPKPYESKLQFKRLNPTRIEAHLNLDLDQILVFSEAFDGKWRASSKEKEFFQHFKINGYANGYLIPASSGREITLEYFPQRAFRFGLSVSILSFLLLSLTALWIRRSKK